MDAESESLMKRSPLVEVTNVEELLSDGDLDAPCAGSQGHATSPECSTKQLFAYNEYGELMEYDKINERPKPSELTVLQTMRLLNKVYHNEFRDKMWGIIAEQLHSRKSEGHQDCCRISTRGRLFTWDFQPGIDQSYSPCSLSESTMSEMNSVSVYTGPPRVLEIGCGDGKWSFSLKRQHPDWIVEGVDNTDQWTAKAVGIAIRDFMKPHAVQNPKGYFDRDHIVQEQAEFTVRNFNTLLEQPNPMSHNLYSFVRGVDVFDRVESYKSFLDDIRLIMQPNGVVEFIEIDPRPRAHPIKHERVKSNEHISLPTTDWTDKIEDRFEDATSEGLATDIPAWMQRVDIRLQATLRAIDGVPGAQLKTWLEGAGFWQDIIPLSIGGNTASDVQLLGTMEDRVQLENSIPLLAARLPTVVIRDIDSGKFFVNLHVVTGPKPKFPRPGDMLMDGNRWEVPDMTAQTLEEIDRRHSSAWERFNLDRQLSSKVQDLTVVPAMQNP